ncbi:EscI/YscI/HrpB family type III secretion system inner rod protein [Vibrio owensii]|uniref:EscI/YscI/HrpB family type III secretion system inner rod protein n=1 Tax=Vibrio owensii TaxID=696485 RepID=A0AAU9Q5U3_9VIBR|nr:EscI/YscI/HrpB family type III secretion system inner rod protein [Vibrio owensii]
MKIQPTEQGTINAVSHTGAPNSTDVDWFSARIGHGNTEFLPNATALETTVVREVLAAGRNRQRFDDSIQKVVNTRDPLDLLNVSRSMSEYYTHTMLATKIIAKGVQSVEKLTSLQ